MFQRTIKGVFALAIALVFFATIAWITPASAGPEPYIGEISIYAFNFAPRDWANCDGQLLPISQNTALFSLLGTTYGGDGRTTFALPDLRGRVAIHTGHGPGLSNRLQGSRGGQESVNLSVVQIPSHNHTSTATVHATDNSGDADTPSNNVWAKKARDDDYSSAAPDVNMQAGAVTVTIGNTGGNQAHENMPPFLTLRYCIALQGVFPPRN